MREFAKSLKRLYEGKIITLENIKNRVCENEVSRGEITKDEYEFIVGEPYVTEIPIEEILPSDEITTPIIEEENTNKPIE